MKTAFSHRPLAGVSVGARNENGKLYVAFALTNDGSSRNGIFWEERRDVFCRKTARNIIDGRIDNAISDTNSSHPMVYAFESDLDARDFINQFRETFKPTPDETDDFLCDSVTTNDGVVLRYRKRADDILFTLYKLADEVLSNASVYL